MGELIQAHQVDRVVSAAPALVLGQSVKFGQQFHVGLDGAPWQEGRVVQLTPETTSALADWLPSHPDWQSDGGRRLPAEAPLFVMLGPPKHARQAIAETGLLRQVLRHAEQVGIPAHLRYPYVLRHYWATQEVSRGDTVAELQARGGWRDRRSAQAHFQRPPAARALAIALGLDHRTPPPEP